MKYLILTALFCTAAVVAQAEEATPLTVELNSLSQEADGTCRLTFTLSGDNSLSALETQTVLFDTAGTVRLFTLFDFGSLPKSGLRVRQFDIPDLPCADLGMVLINGVERCETELQEACLVDPKFSSRIPQVEIQQ